MDLSETLGLRPSPGRLIGQRSAITLEGNSSSLGDGRQWHSAVARIRRAVQDDRTVDSVANSGVLNLLTGDLEQAIEQLEWAVAQDPHAATLSDLSAAYLARATADGQVMDLIRALDTARRAVALEPARPEAVFNFALALTRLHLRKVASKVWERFLEIEPNSSWAEEARSLLRDLQDESYSQNWKTVRGRLFDRSELTESFVRRAVNNYPYEIRDTCEREILAAWAAAVLDRDSENADFWLSRAAILSEGLASQRSEYLLKDEVEGIRSSRRSPFPGPDLATRARVWSTFLRGLTKYEEHDFAAARRLLESSLEPLQRAASPFSLVAELYAAICRHYSDLPGASVLLEGLIERVPEKYPTVLGRAWWMLGTVVGNQRYLEDASQYYLRALPLLEQGAGPTRAASGHLLLAELYDVRGEVARGWRHRIRGLDQLTKRGTPRRRFGVVFEAGQALARHGRDDVALLFLDEAVEALEVYEAAPAGAEVHIERARIWNRMGKLDNVRNELGLATAFLERVEESGLKGRLRAVAGLTEGLALAETDPEHALELLEEANQAHEVTGYRYDEMSYFSGVARIRRTLGDEEGTRRALQRAVDSYDHTRKEASQMVSRIDSFQPARGIFDQLIALAIESPQRQPSEGFYWAERSRAQTILDLWSTRSSDLKVAVATAEEVAHRLDPGTILLEYAVVDGQLVCWIFRQGESRFTELTVAADQLAGKISAFTRALADEEPEDVLRKQGRDLYKDLIAPLHLMLATSDRLIVVPDGPLRHLPFATLVDSDSGRYLVEINALAFAPSATLFLLAEERWTRSRGRLRLLVVGEPLLEQGPYSFLPELRSAKEEAEAIAFRFPGSDVLLGSDATRMRVLELLPYYNALHFSGHALASRDGWGGSALILSPTSGYDEGLLRVTELMEHSLEHLHLVTLSACETLEGYDSGREGTAGLAQAFFAAGVPSVIGTLWRVDDDVSSELMLSFYLELGKVDTAAEALRLATMALLKRGDVRSSPAFWGAFAVIGS